MIKAALLANLAAMSYSNVIDAPIKRNAITIDVTTEDENEKSFGASDNNSD